MKEMRTTKNETPEDSIILKLNKPVSYLNLSQILIFSYEPSLSVTVSI